MSLNRRTFLVASAAASGSLVVPTLSWSQTPASAQNVAPAPGAPQKVGRPPALALELVKEFVGAAHGNLQKTQAMLAETPGLLNATWDWGGGDFEKAIGGAGHMGRPDIANFLIGQGAHFDIFVAAMLGRLDMVKAGLTAYPNLANSKGPHGIPLMVHAQKGGENALAVVEFLKSIKSA